MVSVWKDTGPGEQRRALCLNVRNRQMDSIAVDGDWYRTGTVSSAGLCVVDREEVDCSGEAE